MKKLALTIAIVLGMSIGAFAQYFNNQGGLFQMGPEPREYSNLNRDTYAPLLLPEHASNSDQSAQDVPLGSDIAVLIGLGAAYLVGKKRKEE